MTRMAIHRRGFGATVILVGTILALIPAPMATPSAHALAWAVAIDKDGFHPQGLTVPVGASVLWTNFDSAEHTVTSVWGGPNPTPTPTQVPPGSNPPGPTPEPGTLFDLVLAPGESGSITFEEPGNYDYLCSNHPDETGYVSVRVILVTPAPSPSLPDAAAPPAPGPPGSPALPIGLALMAVGLLAAIVDARRHGRQ